ncbi:MAG: sulfotransferase [Acidimicrobiales bacterium]|nr:sulfotransferase [Acidimicrobiales bacterium]MCB1014190.1 sulfotransferase [Acidimicrobiales bacterium]MCB9372764.1 sulfotransferase [Microthrixaceae bacterium]
MIERAAPTRLFLGGLHRSGTSLLHRALSAHPDVAGFSGTGAPEDEGQHLQTVMTTARAHGGPGHFAFDPASHLTEASPLAVPASRDRLEQEWGRHLPPGAAVVVEKSPPNIVRARFLQALFADSAFVFIVRHPASVALATRRWSSASMAELVLHWHVAHAVLARDLPHLRRAVVLRFEDFLAGPAPFVARVQALVGLSAQPPPPFEVRAQADDAYRAEWRDEHQDDARLLADALPEVVATAASFGYSLADGTVVEPTGDCPVPLVGPPA